MRIKKVKNLDDYIKVKKKILRYFYFSRFKKKGRKFLFLLKKSKYIQAGLDLKNKRINTRYLMYKTLNYLFNNKYMKNKYANNDYLNILNYQKIRNDYSFNFNKKKKVLSVFDLFYCNKTLLLNNLVPILLTQTQYNLYDKNYKILQLFKFVNIKKRNILYLKFYDYSDFNYLYFLNLYLNLKNIIFHKFSNVVSNYNSHISKVSNIFNLLYKINKLNIFDTETYKYVKFNSNVKFKKLKVLNKYLIKNKMFRAGKFFYFFLQYMKSYAYRVYENNLLYGKFKYMKLNGYKYNTKLMSFNLAKITKLKGWFHIFNYIKKYSYFSYNENKNKTISYFVTKYHHFYCFIIRFFYKILNNLKFMFIDKFNFKKILFLKIVTFYIFYNKWYKFKHFRRCIRKRIIKKWKIRRIVRFSKLGYVNFVLRIKNKILNKKIISRFKLGKLIKKRKKLNFYKFKNSIRIINHLLKLRMAKGLKNPFRKSFRKNRRGKGNIKKGNFKKGNFRFKSKFTQLYIKKPK